MRFYNGVISGTPILRENSGISSFPRSKECCAALFCTRSRENRQGWSLGGAECAITRRWYRPPEPPVSMATSAMRPLPPTPPPPNQAAPSTNTATKASFPGTEHIAHSSSALRVDENVIFQRLPSFHCGSPSWYVFNETFLVSWSVKSLYEIIIRNVYCLLVWYLPITSESQRKCHGNVKNNLRT